MNECCDGSFPEKLSTLVKYPQMKWISVRELNRVPAEYEADLGGALLSGCRVGFVEQLQLLTNKRLTTGNLINGASADLYRVSSGKVHGPHVGI
jgi:hypothetical protein